MTKKVWVIEENYNRSSSGTPRTEGSVSALHTAKAKQKNPALAYSLSLLIWGCGQLYNKRWKTGTLLLLFMIIFYSSMSMFIMSRTSLASFFESINISRSGTLLICGFFYLSGILTWYFNSCHAYFTTIKINGNSFEGLKSVLFPAVCSLLIPGWGQFLNGQPQKGIFFQILGLTGLAAFPVIIIVFLLWPTLEVSQARLIVEWIFTISIISIPFVLLIWLLNIYDAASISMNDMKKEPPRKRIGYYINRYRHNIQIHGRKNAILKIVKRIVLVILLLSISIISYRFIPKEFYIQKLKNVSSQTSQDGMTVIPALINNFCSNITTTG